MKKITFLIAALIGLAIVSCSTHDETLSTNVGIQKTVQYDEDVEMERYYESYLNFLDSIMSISPNDTSYIDSIAIDSFSEHWNWLFSDSDVSATDTLFRQEYQDYVDLIFTNYINAPMNRRIVHEIIDNPNLYSIEKMLLLDFAASCEFVNKYGHCFILLEIDNQDFYITGNYKNWFDNPQLTDRINGILDGVGENEIIIVFKNIDGDLDFSIVEESWLTENRYQNISQEQIEVICNILYLLELDQIAQQFKSDLSKTQRDINNNRSLYGASPNDYHRMSLSDEEKMLKMMQQALRNYWECLGIEQQSVKESYAILI